MTDTRTIEPARLNKISKPKEESKLIDVSTSESTRGIAFRSLAEVEHALRVFNGEVSGKYVAASGATEDILLQHVGDSPAGGLGVGLLLLGSRDVSSKQKDFVNSRIMDEVRRSEKNGGRYYDGETHLASAHFDYDAMGTSFFKSSVDVTKSGGSYVLRIWQAYVGDKGEKELIKELGAEPAITSANLHASYSLVEGDQFNINFKPMFSLFAPSYDLRKIDKRVIELTEQSKLVTPSVFEKRELEAVTTLNANKEYYDSNSLYKLVKSDRESLYGIFYVKVYGDQAPPKNPVLTVAFRPAEKTNFDSSQEMAEFLRRTRDLTADMLKSQIRN
jgi:hypothetical protein